MCTATHDWTRPNTWRDRATSTQVAVVEKLLAKGWMDPWVYGRSVRLGLPNVQARRMFGSVYRDWTRRGIRVTPTGRILA